MARRSSSTTLEATEPETTEEAESAEALEATTEPTEAAPAVEIDLTAFEAAVTAAVEGSDSATGDVPTALVDPVKHAYRNLEGGVKAKNKAKAFLQDGIKDGMNKLSIGLARAYMNLNDAVATSTPSSTTRVEKAPADPSEAFVQHVAALRLADHLVTSSVPEGVNVDEAVEKISTLVESSIEAANSYLAWVTDTSEDRADEPEVASVVKSAVKLSQGKSARVAKSSSGSTYSGERRDIAKHIAESFASSDSGTFLSIAEIRSFSSSEYGNDAPSAGAISARLFPKTGKCSLEGVTPATDDKGKKGAVKN